MNVEHKICSKCKIDKPADGFFKDKTRKSGLTPQCKQCHREYRKARDPKYGTSERGKRLWLAKDGYKRCGKCRETKPVAEFAKNKVRPDGLQHQCRPCAYASTKATDLKNPMGKKLRMRKAYLKRRYGLNPQSFDLLVFEQNNKCALCHEEMDPPHVDHDHSCCPGVDTCGKCIRALLCENCNRGLGMFKDNTELLLRAVSYLDSYKAKEPLVSGP